MNEILRESVEKISLANLSNILNSLNTMIYVTDPDTNTLIFMNDTMRQHYNIEDNYAGKPCYKLLQKDMDYRCDFCPCNRLEKEPDKPIVWEERSTLTNRTYQNTDSFITLPNGRKVHLQHSIDITEQKEMTAAIRQNYKRQILMTYLSRSFLSGGNTDALINNAFHRIGVFMGVDQILLMKAEDDITKLICTNEWHSKDFMKFSFLNTVVNLPAGMKDKYFSMKKQGKVYITSDPSEIVHTPYRKYFPNFLCVFIFFGDTFYGVLDFSRANNKEWSENNISVALLFSNIITSALQKHLVEEQLIQAKEIAERNSRYKSTFLANMSHEIRTPMNAILGISEIQLQNESLSSNTEDAFKKIYESGNLLLNIINDILDLSKIEAGKMEIIPVKYDIPSLINDTVQLNRLRYESKPINFLLDVDENIPLNMLGDELRIKQILNNILSNAFKYTDKGEVKMTVFPEPVSLPLNDDYNVNVVFRVSDTGQGMTPEQLKLLFSEYTRFNLAANRTTVGTGLGMSITKHLVNLMNGEISAESEEGKGTVITVRLPQKRLDSDVCGPELAKNLRTFNFKSRAIFEKSRVSREYMPYGSVLVVDDVESNLYVANGMLSPYSLNIETVTSGLEAIEKIKSGCTYDIIFMDHMMPKMDGIEAVKILREMGYTGFIIALTANALVGQDEIFLKNGFDGFISKPIDSRELNASLNKFIRDKKPKEIVEAARKERHEKELNEIAHLPNSRNPEEKLVKEKFFILDAERAVKILENICEKPDALISAEYTITVHGIKSALANIGETKLSALANKLEQAAKENNLSVVRNETPAFKNSLISLIEKYRTEHNNLISEDGDTNYLKDKLLEIKTACDSLNKQAAKAALNDLMKKHWTHQISDVLDNISIHLLHSEFEKAAEDAEKIAKSCFLPHNKA